MAPEHSRDIKIPLKQPAHIHLPTFSKIFNPQNKQERLISIYCLGIFTLYIFIILLYYLYNEIKYRKHIKKLNIEVNTKIYGPDYRKLMHIKHDWLKSKVNKPIDPRNSQVLQRLEKSIKMKPIKKKVDSEETLSEVTDQSTEQLTKSSCGSKEVINQSKKFSFFSKNEKKCVKSDLEIDVSKLKKASSGCRKSKVFLRKPICGRNRITRASNACSSDGKSRHDSGNSTKTTIAEKSELQLKPINGKKFSSVDNLKLETERRTQNAPPVSQISYIAELEPKKRPVMTRRLSRAMSIQGRSGSFRSEYGMPSRAGSRQTLAY